MNAQKFTQRSLEAIQEAQSLAIRGQQMQIEPAHLLLALLQQQQGLIPQLLGKLGVSVDGLTEATRRAVEALPQVSGPGREPDKIYVSGATDRTLAAAEETAANMKDEYVSVEHLFLALLEHGDKTVQELLRDAGVQKNAFLQVLATVRGNTRVTDDTPEDTYDALKKYGDDLVERARSQKSRTPSSGGTRRSAM